MRRSRAILVIIFLAMTMIFSVTPIHSQEKSKGVRIRLSSNDILNLYIDPENLYALIIGIDKYRKISNLNNAVFDAKELKRVLIERYKYKEKNIIELCDRNANQRNILSKLRWCVNNLSQTDHLLVYFSGHGHWEKTFDIGHWLPEDVGTDISTQQQYAEEGKMVENSNLKISNEKISGMMKQCKANHIFVVADACFSGHLLVRDRREVNNLTRDYLKKKSRQVLASGRERVSDGEPGKHSPFAKYFLKYLKDNTDKYIIAEKIIVDVKTSVSRNSTQIPVGGPVKLVVDEGGQFIFLFEFYESVKEMKINYNSLLEYLNLTTQSRKKKLDRCDKFIEKFKNIPDSVEVTNIRIKVNQIATKIRNEITIIENMEKEFNSLKDSLEKEHINNQAKITMCNEFLKKFKNAPSDKEVEKMRSKISGTIEILKLENLENERKKLERFIDDDKKGFEEKIKKCDEFLKKFQSEYKEAPIIGQAASICKEVKNSKNNLEKAFTEYKMEINKVFGDLEEYAKQDNVSDEDKLNRFKAFRDTYKDSLNDWMEKKVEEYISKFENFVITGTLQGKKLYETIKSQLSLDKYLDFKKKYPDSPYIEELKRELKSVEKNLPPGKYWESIKKNDRGYYESNIDMMQNGHIMIYIPEKRFWIDKYEVSNRQFNEFLEQEGFKPGKGIVNKYRKQDDEYPAATGYKYAQKYCKGYGFRLPKADEWEYAAGKGRFLYPWGDESPDYNGIYRANYDTLENDIEKDGFPGTAPVKSFEEFSSPFGAVNMAGNVWEWVQKRILKGGCFISGKENMKITRQLKSKQERPRGFRCIMDER
ncbi:MAG: SUMF1/EgtB/PvdO family nonheme iron enzyme [Candidatus Aminicenantes bacterium]|jgi:hypothetical protein